MVGFQNFYWIRYEVSILSHARNYESYSVRFHDMLENAKKKKKKIDPVSPTIVYST